MRGMSPRPAAWPSRPDIAGAEVFIVAAADTVMDRPNADLVAECFPSVQLRDGTGERDTLLAIDKARSLLGYEPAYSWRDTVPVAAGTTGPR